MRRSLVGLVLAVLVAGLVPSAVVAQSPCATPAPSVAPVPSAPEVMPEDYRVALFDGVWKAVDQLYIDPKHNGVDWQALDQEYGQYILQTENAYEVYALLQEMVALLKDPYTAFVPPPIGQVITDPSYGGIGAVMEQQVSETQGSGLGVLYVMADGPASKAGIKDRDRILAVGGDQCPSVDKIRGPVGSSIDLLVRSPGEAPRTVTITREKITPSILPESAVLPGPTRIGYLRLVSLAGQDVTDAATKALEGFVAGGPLDGLILDVRHVAMGDPQVAFDLLTHFLSGTVGNVQSRTGETALTIQPSDLYAKLGSVPVAVLVDGATAGESEVLTELLKSTGRAFVVGQPSSGDAHGVQQIPFPDGSTLEIVTVRVTLPDGSELLSGPIQPDVKVAADWLGEPFSGDSTIKAAVEALATAPKPSLMPMPSLAASPGAAGSPAPSQGAAASAPAASAPGPGSATPGIGPIPSAAATLRAPGPAPAATASSAP
jgi:carboxyl-terminal processing protease